jgi:hypothetical protein
VASQFLMNKNICCICLWPDNLSHKALHCIQLLADRMFSSSMLLVMVKNAYYHVCGLQLFHVPVNSEMKM